MTNEISITIVATGPQATGKTRAINAMTAALDRAGLEITEQECPLHNLNGVEVHTFKARLKP